MNRQCCILIQDALPSQSDDERDRNTHMAKAPDQLPTLEESLTEVTKLIDTMEHGNLSLEQSLAQFERGVTLIKHCQKTLEETEQKVKILLQEDGEGTLHSYGNEKGNSPHDNTTT